MGLHRPYIRKGVRKEDEDHAQKDKEGNFLDANTSEPIDGQYDLGHVLGHEYRREEDIAEQEGLTQAEFNDKMNNPDYYQIEDPSSNRSHKYEMSDEEYANSMESLATDTTPSDTPSKMESLVIEGDEPKDENTMDNLVTQDDQQEDTEKENENYKPTY